MRKNITVCMYCISFYYLVAAVIYTVFYTFVSLSPVLPSYRSDTETLSYLFKFNLSYDRNSTDLGTASVDINITGNGGDKKIRIYNIYQTCSMSYLRQSQALPFQCSHLMTLAKSLGRTGNHMFQYAALLGIAHRHNFTAVISPKFPLINVFNLPNVADIDTSGMVLLRARKCCTYNKKF